MLSIVKKSYMRNKKGSEMHIIDIDIVKVSFFFIFVLAIDYDYPAIIHGIEWKAVLLTG